MKTKTFKINKEFTKNKRYLFVLRKNTMYHVKARNNEFDIQTDENGLALYSINKVVATTNEFDFRIDYSNISIITELCRVDFSDVSDEYLQNFLIHKRKKIQTVIKHIHNNRKSKDVYSDLKKLSEEADFYVMKQKYMKELMSIVFLINKLSRISRDDFSKEMQDNIEQLLNTKLKAKKQTVNKISVSCKTENTELVSTVSKKETVIHTKRLKARKLIFHKSNISVNEFEAKVNRYIQFQKHYIKQRSQYLYDKVEQNILSVEYAYMICSEKKKRILSYQDTI